VGNKAKDDPSKDFWADNVAGTGDVAQNPASCMTMIIIVTMMMMMMMMMMMIHLKTYASEMIFIYCNWVSTR